MLNRKHISSGEIMTSFIKCSQVQEKLPDFYQSTACHICKVSSVSLKRCSRCKIFAYCSPDHQQIHWPQHKIFCKMIKALLTANNKNRCYIFDTETLDELTQTEWNHFRAAMKSIWEQQLGRKLINVENQVWLFPRVCAVCRKCNQKQLIDCEKCISVSYCCVEHQQTHWGNHKMFCSELKLCFDVNNFLFSNKMYPEIKIQISDMQVFPKNMEDFIKNYTIHNGTDSLINVTLISDVLSSFLTLLFGFEESKLLDNRLLGNANMVIHVVGAALYESTLLWNILSELFFTWINNLKCLYIILIGPEANVLNDKTSNILKEMHVSSENNYYHEYVKSSKFKMPDVIIGFNCGLHEYQHLENYSWGPSLEYLINFKNVPFILTSYTEDEINLDLDILKKLNKNLNVILNCQKNKFGSCRPLRDWENPDKPVFYKNDFVAIVNAV